MKRVVRLLRVILSVGKVEFGVCMGGMVVVGGVLAGGLGLGDTVEGLVSVLIGLLHLGRCLGVGIVVGLSEGGIVVVGGNLVVKALDGKVYVGVCMCGNVVVGGIVMAVGGGNVAVSLGLGSTVVVNVIDVVCPFCLCCIIIQIMHSLKNKDDKEITGNIPKLLLAWQSLIIDAIFFWQHSTSYPGLFINNPGTGHEVLD